MQTASTGGTRHEDLPVGYYDYGLKTCDLHVI